MLMYIPAEWWTDRIQPWVHYVPVQVDYSDLYDALRFVSLPLLVSVYPAKVTSVPRRRR